MRSIKAIACTVSLAALLSVAGCKQKSTAVPANATQTTIAAGTPVIRADGTTSPAGPNGETVLVYPDGTIHALPAGYVPQNAATNASAMTPMAGSDAGAQGTAMTGPSMNGPSMNGPAMTGAAPAAAPAPAPAPLVVRAGERVSVRVNQTLTGRGANVGEPFSGTLYAPITVRGVTAFRRGTAVSGVVASAHGQGHFAGAGTIGIELTQIGGYRVSTSEFVSEVKGKGKRTAGFIGGGAGLGALIGGLAGGGKGALIGAGAGAGAGTAGAGLTGNKDAVIPAESVVEFTLQAPIHVR